MDRKFVVTGGYRSKSKVAEFTEAGTVKYLPRLKTGRYGHACSTFDNDNGDTVRVYLYFLLVKSSIMQVFLVTGGRVSSKKSLSSTEIFVGSVWSYAASLPFKISYMPALTLDNSVFVFGE